jgi:hypothetical protein
MCGVLQVASALQGLRRATIHLDSNDSIIKTFITIDPASATTNQLTHSTQVEATLSRWRHTGQTVNAHDAKKGHAKINLDLTIVCNLVGGEEGLLGRGWQLRCTSSVHATPMNKPADSQIKVHAHTGN